LSNLAVPLHKRKAHAPIEDFPGNVSGAYIGRSPTCYLSEDAWRNTCTFLIHFRLYQRFTFKAQLAMMG